MGETQFWAIATIMVATTTAIIAVPLFWRSRAPAADNPVKSRRWLALSLGVIVPLAALGIYRFAGRPDLLGVAPSQASDDVATQHARMALRGGEQGGDLDAATDRLRARLAANPADASGWRLLAQSYEFQGRSADAAAALRQAEAAEAGAPLASLPASATSAAPAVMDAESTKLVQSAQEHRRKREFAAAVTAFASLAKRGVLNADLWADYADALGGARGGLDDEAAACIAAALRLNPDHPKALWLEGSLQVEQGDHAAALATWQHLARVLPADSPDARIIAANLDEARQALAKTSPPPTVIPHVDIVELRGSVRLDPRWAKRVGPDDVLFVLARAADERGPPLAVMRTRAGPWPIQFTLDDRNAMLPDRKLSDFARVILEARISHSGNPLAQPGDLHAVSAVLNPRAAGELKLTIADEVPANAPAQGG